jgi:flagellar biosynthesis activator protein FlaF
VEPLPLNASFLVTFLIGQSGVPMLKNPYHDYNTMAQATLSGRELEAHVLTKAANKLKSCRANWNPSGQNQSLNEALEYNKKIWSFFQVELADKESELPTDLRQNLLNLSLFIDKQTFNIISCPDPAKLNVLIDINLNIASGLRATP